MAASNPEAVHKPGRTLLHVVAVPVYVGSAVVLLCVPAWNVAMVFVGSGVLVWFSQARCTRRLSDSERSAMSITASPEQLKLDASTRQSDAA